MQAWSALSVHSSRRCAVNAYCYSRGGHVALPPVKVMCLLWAHTVEADWPSSPDLCHIVDCGSKLLKAPLCTTTYVEQLKQCGFEQLGHHPPTDHASIDLAGIFSPAQADSSVTVGLPQLGAIHGATTSDTVSQIASKTLVIESYKNLKPYIKRLHHQIHKASRQCHP